MHVLETKNSYLKKQIQNGLSCFAIFLKIYQFLETVIKKDFNMKGKRKMKETAIYVKTDRKSVKSLKNQKKDMAKFAKNFSYEIIESDKRKAVIYARSSKKDDNSIMRQIESCQKYADEHNIEIVEIFIDNGVTHKKKFFTKFNKMVRKAKKADWNVVILDTTNRISRSSKIFFKRLGKLNRYGKEILSVTEDTTSDEYKTICSFLLKGGKI